MTFVQAACIIIALLDFVYLSAESCGPYAAACIIIALLDFVYLSAEWRGS